MWKRKPQITPDKEINPAFLPWVIDLEIRYNIFGPGLITKIKAAKEKTSKLLKGIIMQINLAV
jgi:hypothetical protein